VLILRILDKIFVNYIIIDDSRLQGIIPPARHDEDESCKEFSQLDPRHPIDGKEYLDN
jgi:hypothetical protein